MCVPIILKCFDSFDTHCWGLLHKPPLLHNHSESRTSPTGPVSGRLSTELWTQCQIHISHRWLVGAQTGALED